MHFLQSIKKFVSLRVVSSCFVTTSFLTLLLTSTSAQAVSFGLDDSPATPIGIPPPFPFAPLIPGTGAEAPFGPGGLAPSPTLGLFPVSTGDGAILSPGPVPILQHPGALFLVTIGLSPTASVFSAFTDSFSSNHADQTGDIEVQFSVDRNSPGLMGDVVIQSGLGQQPGDIFKSTKTFTDPSTFVGSGLFADTFGTFGGTLPSAGVGPTGSNTLSMDESALGLTVTGVPGVLTPLGIGCSPTHSRYPRQCRFI